MAAFHFTHLEMFIFRFYKHIFPVYKVHSIMLLMSPVGREGSEGQQFEIHFGVNTVTFYTKYRPLISK